MNAQWIAPAACFSFFACQALSADLIYSPTLPGHVIGVEGLFVPATGKNYDVVFDERSFVDIFGDPLSPTKLPTFWSGSIDGSLAISARNALNEKLNAAVPIPERLRNPQAKEDSISSSYPTTMPTMASELEPFGEVTYPVKCGNQAPIHDWQRVHQATPATPFSRKYRASQSQQWSFQSPQLLSA